MSATQARVHFGEVLRRVRENEIITVEHAGKPEAIIMSVEEYERLRAHTPAEDDWWDRLMETRALFPTGTRGQGDRRRRVDRHDARGAR
jgi:prevent-host-death family protein